MNGKIKNGLWGGVMLLACVLGSCSKERLIGGGDAMSFKAIINLRSYATDSHFSSGDEIGVYVTAIGAPLLQTGNHADNVLFVSDGLGNLTSSTRILWNGLSTGANIYAYYPYVPAGPTPIAAYVFTAQTAQNTAAGYTASDFISSVSLNNPVTLTVIPLTFSHRMSQIVVHIENLNPDDTPGPPVTEGTVAINDVNLSAVIDLGTGVATAGGTTLSSVEALQYTDAGLASNFAAFKAIVAPQTVGEISFSLTVNGNAYVAQLTGTRTFTSGQTRLFVLQVGSGNDLRIKESTGGFDWVSDGVAELPVVVSPALNWASGNLVVVGTGTAATLEFATSPDITGLMFKYGGVVGVDGTAATFNPAADVLFNPSGFLSFATWANIPFAPASGFAPNNPTDITNGIGDPCQLVGLTIAEIQSGTVTNGTTWRLPNPAELEALADNRSLSGGNAFGFHTPAQTGFAVAGFVANDGTFIPAAGYRDGVSATLINAGTSGYLWSNFASTINGFNLSFSSTAIDALTQSPRYTGFPVRCVR